MKKKFVKVALLSVLTCGLPAAFTSCDDDGWKDRTNVLDQEMAEKGELIDKLSEQAKALETQIAQCKSEGEAAQKAADAAMEAAKKAQTAGDDAMAAAKAADAAAKLAEAAAADAKAEAAAALKAQYDELIALINANANEIAANKALIEGNKALIDQYKGLIDGNTVKINDNAGAIAKILEQLNSFATSDAVDSSLKEMADEINKKLEAAGVKTDNALAELNGTVAGINAAVIALQGQADGLGVQIAGLEDAMNKQLGSLEANLSAKIAAEATLRENGDKELQDQIDALQAELKKLNIATNIEEFTKFIGETNTQLNALKAYDKALEEKLGTIAGQVAAADKLIKENQDKIAKLTTDLNAAAEKAAANAKLISDQAVLIKANADAIATANTNIEELKGEITNLYDNVLPELSAAVDAQIESINKNIDKLGEQIAAVTPQLVTFVMDQLRGLVFIPNSFVGGIESALSYNMRYFPLTTRSGSSNTVTANINNVTYKIANRQVWDLGVAANAKEIEYSPITEISYHLNPTSAKVNYEDLAIVSNDAEILSRAAKAGIELDKTYNDNKGLKIENGVLSVAITGDASVYGNTNKMPVFALQANVYSEDKDGETVKTTVTSDYAMFAQMNVTPDCFQFNKVSYINEFGQAQGREPREVHETIGAALSNLPVNVAWNGSVNIGSVLEIVYNDTQRGEKGIWSNAEEWGKFGLKLNFALIDYTIGNNTVSESSWASIDPETGVLTACVNGDASKQSTDALGHMPLVYVTATDGDNVVIKGFIRVKIVPSESDYKTAVLSYDNVDFNCETSNGIETNENILNMMLETTGLSMDVFLANYKPDTRIVKETYENGIEYDVVYMNQYQYDGVFLPLIRNGKDEEIGEVLFQELANHAEHVGGEIIKPEYHFVWALDTEAKQIAYEKAKHTATTYVCFKSDDEDVFPYVYLPMQITVNDKPVANVGDKMEARWFRNLTTALLNVEQPTNNKFVETIKTDLNFLWQGSKPTFKQISGKPAIDDKTYATQNGLAGGYRYYFPDAQKNIEYEVNGEKATVKFTVTNKTNPCLIGGNYSNANMGNHALLVVKDNEFVSNGEYSNDAIYANGKLLATLDQQTGVVTLATTPEAQTLLNLFASDGNGLDRTNAKLQVQVGVVAYNKCGIALELKENAVIPSTFLRPINIVPSTKTLDFTDATENGSKVDVYSLLDFSDWRSVGFANNEWLFAYYNVKGVTVHTKKIRSNAGTIDSDPTKFVVDASVNEAFNQDEESPTNFVASDVKQGSNSSIKSRVQKAFGKIVYDNKRLNIQKFEVIIPMTIDYELGSFDVEVKCVVNATK